MTTVLTIAGLTLREAARRRVLLALAVLTVLLLTLSGWGFSRLAAESGGSALTSGEARLTASILLNLVMFGFSLIAALGTAFLAGPTLSGETESGIALAVLSPLLGPLFSSDPAVLDLLVPVLLVAAAAQPLAGIVFVLDGVLIGAGDGVYLAWAQLVTLLLFAPAAWLVSDAGLTWLWGAFAVCFMGGRAVTLLLRARGDRWMRLGA